METQRNIHFVEPPNTLKQKLDEYKQKLESTRIVLFEKIKKKK